MNTSDTTPAPDAGFKGATLFEEPWWLDLVARGTWRELGASDGADCSARLTVEVYRRHGITLVRNPPLTPSVGPALRLSAQKHEGRVAQVRALVEDLIKQLPPAHVTRLVFAPGFDDFLSFRWAGYQVSLTCTHRLDDLGDLDRIWAGFGESTRRAIRKAQKSLVVRDDRPESVAVDACMKSFARQGRILPFRGDLLARVAAGCRARDNGKVLVAEGADGVVHAAAVVVHDARCAYYIAGGADPALRASGAQSLLMWEAIRHSAGVARAFDFEGSSHREIERFFRGFGPVRVPLLVVTRRHPVFETLGALGVLPRQLGAN